MMNLLDSLEQIFQAAKEHDEGKATPINEFFSNFEKKYALKRNKSLSSNGEKSLKSVISK